MKYPALRKVLPLLCVIVLSSCATTTKVNRIGTALDSKETDCKIDFYRDSKPSKEYKAVGKIESHIKRNFFFGGKVNLDDAYRELREKACNIGGDGVVIDDYMETTATEMTHVHVWATVIKYQ